MKHLFWTYGYRPFVMGGNVNYIIATSLTCTGPHHVGKGVKVYVAKAPNGRFRVCEKSTGAIIGDSLEQVKLDLKMTTPKMIKEQISKAKWDLDQMDVKKVTAEEFWAYFKKA